MSSTTEKKETSTESADKVQQADSQKSGGENAEAATAEAKPIASKLKMSATAKEWKPSAAAASFTPKNVAPQGAHPGMQGFAPGYSGQGGEFYGGNVPQGIPMVQGPNGMPVPAMYYNAQGFPMPVGYHQGMPPMGYSPGFNPQMSGGVPGQSFFPGPGMPQGVTNTGVGGNGKANSESGDKSEGSNEADDTVDTNKKDSSVEKGPSEVESEGKSSSAASAPAEQAETEQAAKEPKDKKDGGKKPSISAAVTAPSADESPAAGSLSMAARLQQKHKENEERAMREKAAEMTRKQQQQQHKPSLDQEQRPPQQKKKESAGPPQKKAEPAKPLTMAEKMKLQQQQQQEYERQQAALAEAQAAQAAGRKAALAVDTSRGGGDGSAASSQPGSRASPAVTDRSPLPRGQTVPSATSSPRDGGDGGWKRGANIPTDNLVERKDGHKRYTKQQMLALFTRNKACPDEIKSQYTEHSKKERSPLQPREGGQGNMGGRQGRQYGRNKGKQEEEPHPDEAEIFDFSKKGEDTFRFQADRLADETDPDVIMIKARTILNKLSVTKFEKLSDEFMTVGIDNTAELIDRAVEQIISKAQMEEHFCFMYADLCAKIHNAWDFGVDKEEESNGKYFRTSLLNKCRDEFDIDRTEEIEKIRANTSLQEDEKEEMEILAKKRYTGHMRFIGELFLKDMVNAKTMNKCIGELVQETDEETLVCMCKLMLTVGDKLESYDRRKGHDNFVRYFDVIKDLSVDHPSSRTRFMLKDLIDARNAGWQERREEERAVHLSVLRNTGNTTGKMSMGGGDARGHGRTGQSKTDVKGGQANSDEWQTVSSTSGKKGRSSGFNSSGNLHQAAQGGRAAKDNKGGNFGALGRSGGFKREEKKENKSASKGAPPPPSSDAGPTKEDDASSLAESLPLSRQASDLSAFTLDDNLPGADGTLTKDIVIKVRSIVEEYYMNEDPAEALLSLRELIHPLGMADAIGSSKGILELVFEKFPNKLGPVCDLLVSLWDGGNEAAFLSSPQATAGVLSFLDTFDDIVIDVPLAGSISGEILAHLIDKGVVALSLFDAIPEENMFTCSPRKASFQASVLLALSKRPGQTESKVCDMYKQCGMDVIKDAIEARAPRQSEDEAREEFLGKFPVQFLSVE